MDLESLFIPDAPAQDNGTDALFVPDEQPAAAPEPSPQPQPEPVPQPEPAPQIRLSYTPPPQTQEDQASVDAEMARLTAKSERLRQQQEELRQSPDVVTRYLNEPADPAESEFHKWAKAYGVFFGNLPKLVGKGLGMAEKGIGAVIGKVAGTGDTLEDVGQAVFHGTPLPVEKAAEEIKGIPGVAARVGLGIAETLPKIALLAAFPQGLAAQSIGAGAIFGLDAQGNFSLKSAAIGALLPGAGMLAKNLAARALTKGIMSGATVLENRYAQAAVEELGHQAALNTVMIAGDAPELIRLYQEDPEKAKRQVEDIVGQNLAWSLFGIKKWTGAHPTDTQRFIANQSVKYGDLADRFIRMGYSGNPGMDKLRDVIRNMRSPTGTWQKTPQEFPPSQLTEGEQNAIIEGQEVRQPKYIGIPPGQNIQPNPLEVRQGEGGPPSGSGGTVGGGIVPPETQAEAPPVVPPVVEPPKAPEVVPPKPDFIADNAHPIGSREWRIANAIPEDWKVDPQPDGGWVAESPVTEKKGQWGKLVKTANSAGEGKTFGVRTEKPAPESSPEEVEAEQKAKAKAEALNTDFLKGLAQKYGTPVAPTVPAAGHLETLSRASNMLERAADKSTTPDELAQILKEADGMPDESRIANAVANNPYSDAATFESALANPELAKMVAPDWSGFTTLRERRAELRNQRGLDKTEPTAPAKLPWQLTRDQFIEAYGKLPPGMAPGDTRAQKRIGARLGRLPNGDVWHTDEHGIAVQAAMQEGKPVPPEVLAEYPELKPKIRLTPPTAPPSQQPKPEISPEWETMPINPKDLRVGDRIFTLDYGYITIEKVLPFDPNFPRSQGVETSKGRRYYDPTEQPITIERPKVPPTGNLPEGITQEQMKNIRAQLKYAEGLGVKVGGIRQWVEDIESGDPARQAQQPGAKETLDALNIAIAEFKKQGPPVAPADFTLRSIITSPLDASAKARSIAKYAKDNNITVKQAQERIEAEIVKMAHETAIAATMEPRTKFGELLRRYEKQPTLSARTSTSVQDQAYSTPAPLSYALAHAIDVTPADAVYDSTAGNGMLLIGGNLRQSQGNEINPERAAALRKLGVGTVTENDGKTFVPFRKFPKIRVNPPFGGIDNVNYDGYGIRKLEHLISLKALEAMKDNGQATLILGANREEGPRQGKGAQWIFENYLYGHYNVVGNFEVSGDLYAKQGAKWPVRVIVIDGRRKVPIGGELAPKEVARLNTWDDVWKESERIRDEIRKRSTVDAGGGTGLPLPPGPGPAPAGKPGTVPGAAGEAPPGTGKPGEPGGTRTGEQPPTGQPGGGAGGPPSAPSTDEPTNAEINAGKPGTGKPAVGVAGEGGGTPEGAGGAPGAGKGGGGKPEPGKLPESPPVERPASDLNGLSEAELDALLNDVVEEEAPTAPAPTKPTAPKPTIRLQAPQLSTEGQPKKPAKAPTPSAAPTVKSPSEIIAEAAKFGVKGADEAIKGLSELFGGGTHMGANFPTFSEESYAKAKPHFRAAYDNFVASGKSLKEFFQFFVKQYGAPIIPFLKRFVQDVQAEPPKLPPQPQKESEFQVAYEPGAEGNPFGTLTPKNIAAAEREALDSLKNRVGPITDWVANRLNMNPEELRRVAASEQIDGAALAIHHVEESGDALVIGDEAGIGKGRQGALLIRYAMLQGKVPIFFTKFPKLFTDMYGDLKDINSAQDLKPLILGNPSESKIKDQQGNVVHRAPGSDKQKSELARIREVGWDHSGYNAIFTTYSQVNVRNARQVFLEWIARENPSIVILDESHESAGDAGTSMQAAFMTGGQVQRGSGATREMIQVPGLLRQRGTTKDGGGGVLYMSATFAKRAENMPVYFRTALRRSARGFAQIVDAMKRGGTAMQQAVSEALAKAGQYLRRERDFTGVSYTTVPVQVADEAKLIDHVDQVTDVLSQIVDFSERIRAAVLAQAGGGSTAMTQNQIDMNDFAAIVHNQVSQLLLAAKADAVVDTAIKAHKAGEKPVVALMNTMESFLEHYVEDHDVKDGQKLTLRWHELLKYALSRTLRIKTTLPNGDTVISYANPAEFGLEGIYNAVMAAADGIESNFSISPIDHIIQKLEQAGVKMVELTGRKSGLRYTNFETGEAIYRRFKKANKNDVVNGFNSKIYDGMLLNASGSTGLSAHASVKFSDQRPRHMMIAQPALDVAVFIQTLGRIKRTGMVMKGVDENGQPYGAKYSYLVLPLQAELRPAAMAARKMKSLNANTTAESESHVKIEAEDLFNRYGDEIVTQFLDSNDDFRRATGLYPDRNQDGSLRVEPETARKFTGRIALMTDADQKRAYEAIIPAYKEKIQQLKETGEYDLEIVVHDDWDAKLKHSSQLAAGTDESNIFTAGVKLEQWEIKDSRHVPTGEEMKGEFDRKTGGMTKLNDDWRAFREDINQKYVDTKTRLQADRAELVAKGKGTGAIDADLTHLDDRHNRWINDTAPHLANIMRQAGRVVDVRNAETGDVYDGMIVDVKMPKGRTARGMFRFKVMLYSPGGVIYVTAAEFAPSKWSIADAGKSVGDLPAKASGQRYDRYFVVGNPIQGYDVTGGRGKLVRFKATDDSIVTGLLMPNNWGPGNLATDPRLDLITGKAVVHFLRTYGGYGSGANRVPVESGNLVKIQRAGDNYEISTSAARRTGGAIFLDRELLRSTGDFTKTGQRMVATFAADKLEKVANRVMAITQKSLRPAGDTNTLIPQVKESNAKGGKPRDLAPGWGPVGGEAIAVDSMGKNAVLIPPGQRRELLPAFHGTPHEVEKFSLSKVGTGEGVQVYGWGLYFAEHPEVAEAYKRMGDKLLVAGADARWLGLTDAAYNKLKLAMTSTNKSVKTRAFNELQKMARVTMDQAKARVAELEKQREAKKQQIDALTWGEPEQKDYRHDSGKIEKVTEWIRSDGSRVVYWPDEKEYRTNSQYHQNGHYDTLAEAKQAIYDGAFEIYDRNIAGAQFSEQKAARVFDAVTNKDFAQTFGNLYTVDLTSKPEELLDWDKTLSEQSDYVKKAINNPKLLPHGIGGEYAKMNAGTFYQWAQKFLGPPAEVSAAMLKAGIKGIRYLDQMSRVDQRELTEGDRETLAQVPSRLWPDGVPGHIRDRIRDSKITWDGVWNEISAYSDSETAEKFIADVNKAYRFDVEPEGHKKTYNYVVFDEDSIKITHKNGEEVSPRELAQMETEQPVGPQREPIRLETDAQIRKAINDPDLDIAPHNRKWLKFLLDSGLLKQLPGLKLELVDYIQGGASGEFLPDSRIARILRYAEDKEAVPVHEFLHDLWYFLDPRDQEFIRNLRRDVVDMQAPQMGEKFRNGISSDEFTKLGINRKLYHLANEREFFSWMMTEKAKAELAKPEVTGFVNKIRAYIQKLWQSLKDAIGATPHQDALWRRIYSGKYEYMPVQGEIATERELAPKFKAGQMAGVKEVTPEKEVENIERIQTFIRSNLFDHRGELHPQKTEEAWDYATRLTDPAQKGTVSGTIRDQAGGEMAPGLLRNELWFYALKMATGGDSSLLRFMYDHNEDFATFGGGHGGDPEAARVLRAARERADQGEALFKALAEYARDRAKSAGKVLKGRELFDEIEKELSNLKLTPDEFDEEIRNAKDEQGKSLTDYENEPPEQPGTGGGRGPGTGGGGTGQTEIEQRERTREDDFAERYARRVMHRMETRNVEWLKPDRPVNVVAEIIRDELMSDKSWHEKYGEDAKRPALPTNQPESYYLPLRDKFVEAGVEEDTALRLAREVFNEVEARLANKRQRQIERAAGSKKLNALIEDLLNTPYRAQHDPAWRLRTAEDWFLSNGLSRDQAIAAAKLFSTQFDAALQAAGEKAARRLMEGRAEPHTITEVIKSIRLGLTDPSKHWSDALAERTKFKPLTAEQHQQLADYELKASSDEISPQEKAEYVEKIINIFRHSGSKDGTFLKAVAEAFTNSLLSGIRTATVQLEPIIMALRDFPLTVASNPSNAPRMARAMVDAFKKVFAPEFKMAWQTEAYGFHLNEPDRHSDQLRRIWEESEREYKAGNVRQKAYARVKQLYAMQHFVGKFLNSIDQAMMATTREWKLAYYSSSALKEAGFSTEKIKDLIDVIARARQSAFEGALEQGLDPMRAKVRANWQVGEAVRQFMANTTDSESLANKIVKAAENDTYSTVGRRAEGIKESDEGLISRGFMNPLMEWISSMRAKGGMGSILSTALFGFVNIPYRTARYWSQYSPYGLLRYGVHRYRNERGMDTLWKQTFANELQARARLYEAIGGTIAFGLATAWGLTHSTSDDKAGDDKFGIYITGQGPTSRVLRDAWLKKHWQPYSLNLVINGHKAAIPLTRVGEAIMFPFILAAAADDAQWRKKEIAATGRKPPGALSNYAASAIGEIFSMTGQRGIFQGMGQMAETMRGGGGVGRQIAKTGATVGTAIGIPFKQLLAGLSEMFVGPLDQSSSSAIIAANLPIIGLLAQNKGVNRFGDQLYDRSWYGRIARTGVPFVLQVAKTPENERLYTMLVSKGAAAPELRRAVVEEKYGPLTDAQFNKFATISGKALKADTVGNLSELQSLPPDEVKKALAKSATKANQEAVDALGLEPVKESKKAAPSATTTVTSAAVAAPATGGARAISVSTPTGSATRISTPRVSGGQLRLSYGGQAAGRVTRAAASGPRLTLSARRGPRLVSGRLHQRGGGRRGKIRLSTFHRPRKIRLQYA